jgi:hypothetical protein
MANELYENSKARKAQLEAEYESASKRANEIRNSMGGTVSMGPVGGLTPDHIKNHPDYRSAKSDADRAFKNVQNHNQQHLKNFSKEYKAERMARNADRTKTNT